MTERKQTSRGKSTRAGKGSNVNPAEAAERVLEDAEATARDARAELSEVRDAWGRRFLDDFFVSEDERAANSEIGGGDLYGQTGVQSQTVELLAFWVADEEYAIDIVEIQEIIKVPEITEVPRAPRSVLGITSLRGTIVPLVDMRMQLDLPQAEVARASRVLVLRGDGDPLGLLVDRVSSVVRLDRDSIEAVPRTMLQTARELLLGVGRDGDRMLILLDLVGLLNVLETAA